MEADIWEFLQRFTNDELVERRILRGESQMLNRRSVEPLIRLMSENGITQLSSEHRGWRITASGEFRNPRSNEFREGKIEDLENPGSIFLSQNRHINPYLTGYERADRPEPTTLGDAWSEGDEILFLIERDLRATISQLDPGLEITDGGSGKTVAAGRIDITAEDGEGNIVVIKLEAGTAQDDVFTQLLACMVAIDNPDGKLVRGILVANDFAPRVAQAARAVPGVSLKAYSFQFSFQDR